MNSTLRLFFICTLVVGMMKSQSGHALQWGDDKIIHAGASFALNSALYIKLKRTNKFNKFERLLSAAVVTGTLGLAKELGDPVFSQDDLQADLIGVGASSFLLFTFDW